MYSQLTMSSFLLPLLAVLITMATKGQSSGVAPHVTKVAEASNTFALELYQSLQPGFQGENLFYSPMSISTALAMTHMGSRGDTAHQMTKVLRFNMLEEQKLHQAFKELNTLLYDPNRPYVLKSANRLFGQKGHTFLPDFLEVHVLKQLISHKKRKQPGRLSTVGSKSRQSKRSPIFCQLVLSTHL